MAAKPEEQPPPFDAAEFMDGLTEAQGDHTGKANGHHHGGADTRQPIRTHSGELHIYGDAAEQLLADDVFVRAQKLVRFGTAKNLPSETVKRAENQPVIVPVNFEYLRWELNRRADFQKFNQKEKKWTSVNCPNDLASSILSHGDWQHFRPLKGISTAPFLRSDLTVCATAGYDVQSGVLYMPSADFPAVPEFPDKNDAQAALERLLHPFGEFPFADGAAKAAFAAHVLTAVVRHAVDTVPVTVYTAPVPGTGKTLLSSMAARIAHGVEPAQQAFHDDSKEMGKVLLAALMAGDSCLLFDNVPAGQKVRSPELCRFVTASTYSDRILGVSENAKLPNRCSVTLNGNNITPCGDLARRCVCVRLDANVERTTGRVFQIRNLATYVLEHRPQLLVDALTIVRAYIDSGDTVPVTPLESFEAWDRVVRSPLTWLGMADPVTTQVLETDDEVGQLADAFTLMAEQDKFRQEFTSNALADACNGYGADALKTAVESAGCSEATNGVRVGYWLRASKDKVSGGWKLVSPRAMHGVARWKLITPDTSKRVG